MRTFAAVKKNIAFFVFMYALGMVCTYAVLPASNPSKLYSHAWTELFVDVAALTVLLSALPQKLSLWLKRAFYVVAYGVALADVFCYVRFDSTLTPTMLLLVGETNGQEAGEFLSAFLTFDVLFSRFGWVVLLLLVHITWAILWWKRIKWRPADLDKRKMLIPAIAFVLLFCYCLNDCWSNKKAFHRLMSYNNIGDVEHELTQTKTCANLYQPLYRLAFSIRANQLTAKQVDKLIDGIDKVKVDSCRYDCTNVVLIIGESFNRHHAQLYGYAKPTTPRQLERAKRGELTVFNDVVAPWNLTSFVFKHMFSFYSVGDSGEWCDQPLFPEVFRRAGYHVSFLTNQFLPQAKEAVYDFSGGFFLNNPVLSQAMFDSRNAKLSYFDEGLLQVYDDSIRQQEEMCNLTIFHLKGQHVDYRTRYPKKRTKFWKEDYHRPELNDRERQILSQYDNAILYNDSIVDEIIKRFEDRNAVVIYVPDHGEECYEGNVHFYGRMHSTEITDRLAREEFDIPFWIWCSHSFMVDHPETYNRIVRAKNRRYMTDALPHLLISIAGIGTKVYRPDLDLISPQYNENRPRILKNTTDYDVVMGRKK
ncbi:MAG: lipid A phosphoethanolamine transferase [Prevotella sp.]|nr:lipid A phosphoethanolamine transferase [Prevotella sp.]